MISVVLVVLNEAKKLEKCLLSLKGFVDEIIALDLGSIDESIEVCKRFNVKVFKESPVPFVEKVRNLAISKASGDWILVLDPDEMITPFLAQKLKEITESSEYAAVNIPRKNVFFGKWIAHTNWWPDKHVRFFKKGTVIWSDKIHKYPEVSGKVLDLEAKESLAIVHFGYESVKEFMDKQNRYSTYEAKDLFDRRVKFSWGLFIWKPLREFLVRFVKHQGFLDGFYGFSLTLLMMIYQAQVMIKLWELEQRK